jgi:hypothetical protein
MFRKNNLTAGTSCPCAFSGFVLLCAVLFADSAATVFALFTPADESHALLVFSWPKLIASHSV